jgi:hypothetical protein
MYRMSSNTVSVQRLTAEVVGIGGPLASIVSHMQSHGARALRDTSDIPEILGRLLEPPLEELTDGWSDERILDAAAVLRAACDVVCREIYLVSPPNRAQRRARRRP